MAIIKCPECGHEVSDKAPFCPNCGVKIEGNLDVNSQVTTPATTPAPTQAATPAAEQPSGVPTVVPPAVPPVVPPTPAAPAPEEPKKNTRIWVISAIVALLCIGVIFYVYSNANSKDEEQSDYNYAMQSSDVDVLKAYLDKYKDDASTAHLDSVRARLDLLGQVDKDWTNAVVSGSKTALEEYLKNHPDSPHKQEAWDKIDSIDWTSAKDNNTVESFQEYLNSHADGKHVQEAEDAMKKAKSKDLQPEEKQVITSLYRKFFQSINSRNESGLTSTCEDVLSEFLGKKMATSSDVASFMGKLWKEDVANMNWHVANDYQIKKREVGDDEYEYQVSFTAIQEVTHKDDENRVSTHFKVKSTVSPDGKISSFGLVKVVE